MIDFLFRELGVPRLKEYSQVAAMILFNGRGWKYLATGRREPALNSAPTKRAHLDFSSDPLGGHESWRASVGSALLVNLQRLVHAGLNEEFSHVISKRAV